MLTQNFIKMKTILFLSFMLWIAGTGYAQNTGKVSTRNIERNKNIDNKKGYNYFLLDMMKDIDVVYTEYEELIQRVWDKKVNLSLKGTSGQPLKKLDKIKQTVIEMPVFKGGIEYQESVLAYIDAVKKKIILLEKYGILGADPQSNTSEYNDAAIAFSDATNEGIEARNIVRRKKNEYEKTVYMD